MPINPFTSLMPYNVQKRLERVELEKQLLKHGFGKYAKRVASKMIESKRKMEDYSKRSGCLKKNKRKQIYK